MAVQDDQSVKTSIYTNDIHICWSGQNRFHHFSIGFTQLSNLFQPFAIGFNQLSNHVQPISLFFHWFSAVVRHIATFYHRLSSVVQSVSLVWASAFISFFFPVFGNNFKRSSLFKKHTSGARSDQLPFLDGFVTTLFLQFYAVLFFDNSLFPEMAVQDDQSVKTSIYTNDIHICWSGQNRFHHFSIGFTQLSNLFQPFAIGFNQLSNHVQPISLFFSLVFSSCSTYCNILP